jgi:hypothetical protein
MRTALQRTVAVLVMALLAGTGLAGAAAWSPASVGLVGPASAQDDDGDDGDDDDDGSDDDGQAPAGGVQTGRGATAQDDDDDDDGSDDDGQAPAGGVETGRGGTADLLSEPASSTDGSSGLAGVATTVAPFAALALGGVVVGRMVLARRGAAEG